jgi:homoserine dehydrogenase
MSVELDLVLVGFGSVARRFVTLLDEQRGRLERDCSRDWTVSRTRSSSIRIFWARSPSSSEGAD